MPDGVIIPGGPSFGGSPQPPDVPCDPVGDAWRGLPGPAGATGPQGPQGQPQTGGPFLPLTGGALTGALQVTLPGAPNQVVTTALNPNLAIVNDDAQIFSYYVTAASGGTTGDVAANARIYSSITGAPNAYVFNALNVVDYNGTGGSGQLVATYNQALRRIRHAGAGNNPEIFGGVFEVVDFTNTDSALTASMNGIEIDMTCGNTDSAHNRRGLGMYLNRANAGDVAPVVATGVHIAANAGSYDAMINLQSPFNMAAIDLRQASAVTGAAHQIWLGTAGTIALDTTASIQLSGDTTGGMVMTSASGQPARIIYQATGARTWWSGAWSDGSFYITDQTGSANRLTISPAGAFALNGPVTVSSTLTLNADPATALQATTKQYSDTKLARAGGTVTGTLAVNGDVTLGTTGNLITLHTAGSGALQISAETGQPARVIFAPNGVSPWWTGVWADGSYYVSGPGTNRLVIGPTGATTLTCSSLALFDVTTPVSKRTGWAAATGTATRTTFVTGSVTLPALAEHVKALIDDLTAYGLIGP